MKTYLDHLKDLVNRNIITQKEMFILWDKYIINNK